MMTLRRKVVLWVSAVVVTLALVVLPGCKKSEQPKQDKKPASSQKDPTKGME